MPKIFKATIGIAFSKPMFRLSTLSGQLADELLKLRGKSIPEENFANVGRDQQNTTLALYNTDAGVFLNFTQAGMTYTLDYYNSDDGFSFDSFLEQLEAIWKTSDAVLKFPAISRIGFVTEQRVVVGPKSSSLLVDKLITFKPGGFPARFHLTFDDRLNAGHGGLPDPTKDDFINVIRSYYDSVIDAQHPEPDAINANLDVQRYFSPFLAGAPFGEIRKLKKEYDKVAIKFNSDLEQMEPKHAKAA